MLDKKRTNSVWKLELDKLGSRCGQERPCKQNRAERRPPQMYAHK